MLNYGNFDFRHAEQPTVEAELTSSRKGAYFVIEKDIHERDVTPSTDGEGRSLIRAEVAHDGDESQLGADYFHRVIRPAAEEVLGVYSVAEGAKITIFDGFDEHGEARDSVRYHSGPLILRELVPPPSGAVIVGEAQ